MRGLEKIFEDWPSTLAWNARFDLMFPSARMDKI